MEDERPPSTILIVDDAPENIKVLGGALTQDYKILVARDGETALKLARNEPVDMVLLDIVMPDIDGYEVCRRLKADEMTRELPIIFITTLDATEDETTGLELGAVDYITKPFRSPIVKASVKTHMELKAKNDLLLRLANVDGLTGVPNRRCFDVTLEKEWRRAQRTRSPLSLVLMDIDCFKNYNDGKVARSVGISHLRFDGDGKIVLHRDYWDAAGGLYEYLPVVGGLIRWIKGRL